MVLAELLPTLSRLAVRNEFCQKIVELGGLRFVVDLLVKYYDDKDLIESSFFLLKALAGNDDVKREVTKGNAIPLITAALDRHKVGNNRYSPLINVPFCTRLKSHYHAILATQKSCAAF